MNVDSRNKLDEKKSVPKIGTSHKFICITFLKWQNFRDGERISGCKELEGGWREGGGFDYKSTIERILVVMEMFCVSTINATILEVTFSRILQDVTIEENWVSGTWDFPVLFSTVAY